MSKNLDHQCPCPFLPKYRNENDGRNKRGQDIARVFYITPIKGRSDDAIPTVGSLSGSSPEVSPRRVKTAEHSQVINL
jgi:hypothetical protein